MSSTSYGVADAPHCPDEVAAQLFAQCMDVHFDSIAFDFFTPSVDAIFKLRAGKDRARAIDQCFKNGKLSSRKRNRTTTERDLACSRIERDVTDLDERLRAPAM